MTKSILALAKKIHSEAGLQQKVQSESRIKEIIGLIQQIPKKASQEDHIEEIIKQLVERGKKDFVRILKQEGVMDHAHEPDACNADPDHGSLRRSKFRVLL